MKIALIKVFETPAEARTHSVTFDYLSSSIRAAFSTRIDIRVCRSFEEIVDYGPQIVGISTTTETFTLTTALAGRLRQRLDSVLVLGGTRAAGSLPSPGRDLIAS